jgi:hypothetical protein
MKWEVEWGVGMRGVILALSGKMMGVRMRFHFTCRGRSSERYRGLNDSTEMCAQQDIP